MSLWEDIYDVAGVFVEKNTEKPAGSVESAVTPVQEPVKGTNPDGSTQVVVQQADNSMLKWGLIGGGVLVLLLIFVLIIRSK